MNGAYQYWDASSLHLVQVSNVVKVELYKYLPFFIRNSPKTLCDEIGDNQCWDSPGAF